MKFTCVRFLFFLNALQVVYHTTHCSVNNIYAFGSILDFLVHFTNVLTLLVKYHNYATIINVPFWRTVANFWNVDRQPITFVKTPMTSFWYFRRVSIEICLSERTEIIFLWKGWWVVSLFLTDGSLPILSKTY